MLKQKLQKDLNQSLKSGELMKRLVLGMLMTAVKNKELLKRTQLSRLTSQVGQLEEESELTDDEILEVIAGEVKKRKEAAEQFRAGGREELAQKEKSEMDILLTYLPKQLNENEVRTEVQKTISELGVSGAKDMGRVIGAAMAKLKGKTDRGMVSKAVKELLSASNKNG